MGTALWPVCVRSALRMALCASERKPRKPETTSSRLPEGKGGALARAVTVPASGATRRVVGPTLCCARHCFRRPTCLPPAPSTLRPGLGPGAGGLVLDPPGPLTRDWAALSSFCERSTHPCLPSVAAGEGRVRERLLVLACEFKGLL